MIEEGHSILHMELGSPLPALEEEEEEEERSDLDKPASSSQEVCGGRGRKRVSSLAFFRCFPLAYW